MPLFTRTSPRLLKCSFQKNTPWSRPKAQYSGTEKVHICHLASPILKSSLTCSPSITLEVWAHVAADATAWKDGEVHRRADARSFNPCCLTQSPMWAWNCYSLILASAFPILIHECISYIFEKLAQKTALLRIDHYNHMGQKLELH